MTVCLVSERYICFAMSRVCTEKYVLVDEFNISTTIIEVPGWCRLSMRTCQLVVPLVRPYWQVNFRVIKGGAADFYRLNHI